MNYTRGLCFVGLLIGAGCESGAPTSEGGTTGGESSTGASTSPPTVGAETTGGIASTGAFESTGGIASTGVFESTGGVESTDASTDSSGEADACEPDPCENSGACLEDGTCECAAGYEGEFCEADIDDCVDAPCENGGECSDAVDGFTCECAAGYEGDLCETNTDDCSTRPCENGGACVDGIDAYICDCLDGYDGAFCENDIDDCADDPCLNDGTCADEINGFACTCADGYEGDTCETDINDCADDPCLNGGACTDAVNAFSCECSGSFSGDLCECSDAPVTVNYTNRGTFTAASVEDDPPGVVVTGSADVSVRNFNGLGIVGGSSSISLDGSESISFMFGGPSPATTYFLPQAGNGDGDAFLGEAVLEAFGAGGASLGTVLVNGAGTFNVTALFGGAVTTGFTLTADGDSLRIGRISVALLTCETGD